MRTKSVFLCLFLLVVCTSLVSAQGNLTDSELDTLASDFTAIKGDEKKGKEVIEQLDTLSEENRNKFFDKVIKDLGVDSFSTLKDEFKSFDELGNVVLKDGSRVPLSDISEFTKNPPEYSYEFNGEEFEAAWPKISEVEIKDGQTTYSFSDGSTIAVDKDSEFNFRDRKVGNVEVISLGGSMSIKDGEISLGISHKDNEETDLKDFAILKDSSGLTFSPYHERVTDVDLPEGVKKPSSGKFNTFTEGDKTYSVDSDGIIRELKNTKISTNKDGNINSVDSVMIGLPDDSGEIFTKEDTIFSKDDTKPSFDKNFVWLKESDSGDVSQVSINSVGEEHMYYEMKQNLEELELNGNVLVKNGDMFIESDESGKIKIRKAPGSEGEFLHEIDKLYTKETEADKIFSVKKYSGDNEKFNGKITLLDSKGRPFFAGLVSRTQFEQTVPKDQFDRIRMNQVIKDDYGRNVGPQEANTPTGYHEATHGINKNVGNGGYITIGKDENGNYIRVFVPKAGITNSELASRIPQDLLIRSESSSRYDHYVINRAGSSVDYSTRDILSNIDEHSAYLAGFDHDFDNPNADFQRTKYGNTHAIYEYTIFSSSMLAEMKARDPQGWETEKYAAHRGTIQKLLERSMEGISAVNTDNRYAALRSPEVNRHLNTLRTSNDPRIAELRNVLTESYGPGWTEEHFGFGS